MFGKFFISYRSVAIYVVDKLSTVRESIQEGRKKRDCPYPFYLLKSNVFSSKLYKQYVYSRKFDL